MESIIIKSKIREYVDTLSISGDFPQALNQQVIALIQKAAQRARENGRRTIMAKDL